MPALLSTQNNVSPVGRSQAQTLVQAPRSERGQDSTEHKNYNPATGETRPLNTIDRTTNINSLPLLGLVPRLGLDVLHWDDVGEGDQGVSRHNEVCHNYDKNDLWKSDIIVKFIFITVYIKIAQYTTHLSPDVTAHFVMFEWYIKWWTWWPQESCQWYILTSKKVLIRLVP